MKYVILIFLTGLFINAGAADDWGPTGHRATGQIAEEHLSKRAKKKIAAILDGQSLAMVSTFADDIKSDPAYDKYYTWHYVNFALDGTYEESIKNERGDIVTGIEHCIRILRDNRSSKADKAFFLKMLVHFIGDLHQPLHIGRAEDKGGNDIQVQWFGKGTNLHRVWDENMIDHYDMCYHELAANRDKLSKHEIRRIQEGSVIDWMYDSRKFTEDIYNSVETGENLRYRYNYLYFETLRNQLHKGGLRLAKLLNDIFG